MGNEREFIYSLGKKGIDGLNTITPITNMPEDYYEYNNFCYLSTPVCGR